MKIKPNDEFENFIAYLGPSGLTNKALRVKNLQKFIKDINNLATDLLASINTSLITDPATIIAPEYYPQLATIVEDSIELWHSINFPTKDYMLVRTAGFDATYYFPTTEIALGTNMDVIMQQLSTFIAKENPQQVILHPRVSNEIAQTELFAIRAKAIPGDIHVQIGRGGQTHINRVEEATQTYEFNLSQLPANIPTEFIPFIEAIKIIIPIADSQVAKYSQLVNESNYPVYEFKGIVRDSKYLINMFDYEIS